MGLAYKLHYERRQILSQRVRSSTNLTLVLKKNNMNNSHLTLNFDCGLVESDSSTNDSVITKPAKIS